MSYETYATGDYLNLVPLQFLGGNNDTHAQLALLETT